MFAFLPKADEVVEELERYKEQTKVDGETLVRTVFPKRVSEMRELLNSKLFNFGESTLIKFLVSTKIGLIINLGKILM